MKKHMVTMRSALLQQCRANNNKVAVLCNVSKNMSAEDKKKLVTKALEGTEKKALKVESKDGDQYVRVEFEKKENVALFIEKFRKSNQVNADGKPIFAIYRQGHLKRRNLVRMLKLWNIQLNFTRKF